MTDLKFRVMCWHTYNAYDRSVKSLAMELVDALGYDMEPNDENLLKFAKALEEHNGKKWGERNWEKLHIAINRIKSTHYQMCKDY